MKDGRVEVDVEPSVLVWARTSLGMTVDEAAAGSSLSGTLIESLERGTARPDVATLRALADAYKRPTSALLLPMPPEEPSGPEDFRSLPREGTLPLSKRTRLAMRRARRLQAIAKELGRGTGPALLERVGRVGLLDDPELAAGRVREALGVSYDAQRRWRDEAEAFERWRDAVGKLGVLVLRLPMEMPEARAFSLAGDGVPVIVVNSRDSMNGMVFSLLHELGHLVLHDEGLCIPPQAVTWEFRRSHEGERVKRVEVFCNHLAGAILVPRDDLLRQPLVKHTTRTREWPDRELGELVKVFHVSREVVLRRLLLLGKTSRASYERRREEWSEGGEPRGRRGGGKGRNIPRECVSQNGQRFVSLVLGSYRDDRITYSDVADFLDVKVKHIPEIERILEAR